MASPRQLFIDLFARDKTGPGTKSAAENVEDVGDAAKETEKKTEKLGRQANETGRDIAKLDAEAKLLEKELHDLARAFARTDDAAERLDISRTMRKMEADLRKVSKNKGILEKILPDDPEPAAKSFMAKLGPALSSAGEGVATLAGNHVGLTVGAAIGAAAGPVVVSALSSAISAGLGAGVIGVGIMAAAKSDTTIQVAGKAVAQKFGDGLAREADAAFKEPILGSLDILSQAGDQITERLGKSFRKLAPEIEPLTGKIAATGVALTDDLATAAERSGPALDALGDSVAMLGDGVGTFVQLLADGGPEAASNLRLIAGATADLVKFSGVTLSTFEKLSNNVWLTGPLLPLLRKHYDDAASSTATLTAKTHDLSQSTYDAYQATQLQNEATKELISNNNSLYGAQTSAAQAIADATKTIKENGATLDLNSQKGRNNRRTLENLATSLLGAEDAYIKVNGAGSAAAGMQERDRAAFVKAAQAAGLSATEARNLANQLLGIPKKTTPQVILSTNAPTKVKQVKDLLNSIHNKRVSVDVLVNASRLDKVSNTLNRFGGVRAAGGPVKRGKAYVVGEKRAEVFVPEQDGTIIPSIDQYAGGSGGGRASASGPRRTTLQLEVVGDRATVEFVRKLIRTANLLES